MSNGARIFQINASDGGVPKRAIHAAQVNEGGLTVDRQAHPKFHGGLERALCLYSLERIIQLQAEGNSIFPGSTGENVTLSGVDWTALGPGAWLRLGEAVEIEITAPASPCSQIAASFTGERVDRVAADRHPGWSRWYARVLVSGRIRVGEPVEVRPAIVATASAEVRT